MAASTYSILWSLFLAKTEAARRGIIYWLPTDGDVSDFVKTKVDALVSENEDLGQAVTTQHRRSESQNQGLKFFWGTPIYFRGLKSKSGVKAISADAAIYDEFDEADQSQVAQARKRLSASEVKLERELSTPTIPDFGINKSFLETDQCHYAFRCTHCNRESILEEYFPECFQQDKNGSYYHACRHCKLPLDISQGEWVAKYPSSHLRGYQISQLYSPFITPDEIMHEFHNTEFIGHFHNHVLGLPYLSAEDRITSEQVLQLCDNMRKMSANYLPQTSMGIDVGSVLHVTIFDPKLDKLVFCGDVKHFEEIDTLMLKFNTKQCVIDALPETRKVRELIDKHSNKVWACYYNDNQKGSYKWDEVQRLVMVNRTESLDASQLSILRKEISLPQRSKEIELFAEHCQNLVKTVEEDRESGSRRFVYKKIGPDHYRHSFNYAMIAASKMRSAGSFSVFR